MQTAELKKKAAVVTSILKAVGECIQGHPDGVPSGVLYSQLMTYGCSLQQYEGIMDAFISCGQVRKDGNLLFWITKG